MSERETAYYLYCLAPREWDIKPSIAGVGEDRPVSFQACEGISAVFSEVELGEFCGDSAEARLRDLAWLGPRVCRHEAVIDQVLCHGPVLPARFATLFTSVDSLRR